jgi:hypothetical protein
MFIVMMIIVMVSAAGVIVTRSSSLEIRSAGYIRQAGQTHYIAESGAATVIARLRLSCPAFINPVLRNDALVGGPLTAGCPEVVVGTSELYRKPCYNFVQSDGSLLGSTTASVFEEPSGAGVTRHPGSFGTTYITPSFRVTATELYLDATPSVGGSLDGVQLSRLLIDVTATSTLDHSLTDYASDSTNSTHGAEELRATTVILCSHD